ncbi:MAG: SHOCT domain-containing protein [Flavobacteriales bacterium]|nr:SHOCT domain-containing protein [Flavobacteriales bacterium]
MDKISELKKIKSLLDSGAITQDEFDELKASVLGPNGRIHAPNSSVKVATKEVEPIVKTINSAPPSSEKSTSIQEKVTKGPPFNTSEIRKEKKSKTGLFIFFVALVLGGTLLIAFNPKWLGTGEKTPIVLKQFYVFSSKLQILDQPQENANQLSIVPFGVQIGIVRDTVIGDFTWSLVQHGEIEGWLTSKKYNTNYLVGDRQYHHINSIFEGSRKQEILEDMPAYAKYAILNYHAQNDKGDFKVVCNETDTLLPVAYFRSRIGNRNSSSDRKTNKNGGLKDMAITFTPYVGADTEHLVIFSFKTNHSEEIIYDETLYGNPLGLQRISRRSYFKTIQPDGKYKNMVMELDGLQIVFPHFKGSQLLYRSNKKLRLFDRYEIEHISLVRSFIDENSSSIACKCSFTEPFYDLYIHNGIALLTHQDNNVKAYHTPKQFEYVLYSQGIDLINEDDSDYLQIIDDPGNDGMSELVYDRTCILHLQGGQVLYGGGAIHN